MQAGDKVRLTQDVSIVANLARVVAGTIGTIQQVAATAYYNYTVHPPMSAPMQAHQWVVVGSAAETALVTTYPTAHIVQTGSTYDIALDGGITITVDPSLAQPI